MMLRSPDLPTTDSVPSGGHVAPLKSATVPVPPRTAYPPARREPDPDPTLGWVRRLRPLVAAHRGTVAASLTLALIGHVATMGTPLVLKRALDEGLVARTAPLSGFVWQLAVLTAVSFAAGLGNRWFMMRTAALLEYDLRSILQRHLGRQSFAFHDEAETGQLISRANSDLNVIKMFLVFVPSIVMLFVGSLFGLVVMLRADVGLTLVTLSVMPATIVTGVKMRRVSFPLSWLVQSRTADVTTIVEENLAGANVVRAMAAERDQIRRLEHEAEALRWAAEREVAVRARYQPLMRAIPQAGTALFLLAAGWQATHGSVSAGDVLLFTSYAAILQFPFHVLGFAIMMAQRGRAASGRLFEIIDREPDVRDRADAVELSAVAGAITFRDVAFSYPDGTAVLRGFNLDIAPGERVALVGRTASGKSTLAHLLARFHDVEAGAVLVDGIDIRDVTQASLRSHIGVVMDDAFLFTASLRDNIVYARPDATDAEVVAAAEAAGALDFIDALPQRWDTVVGERGHTLSGGQRQRIAIARVLVQNPAILILDDATSAVDVEVELRIHDALEHTLQGRTTLLIAHRPATIALADRVVLLEGGVVTAQGTHAWLLANEPAYAKVLDQPPPPSEPRRARASRITDEQIDRMGPAATRRLGDATSPLGRLP